MNTDAIENDYVWTIEERFELLVVMRQFAPLIWPRTSEQNNEMRIRFQGYRKTPQNNGLLPAWKRKSSN